MKQSQLSLFSLLLNSSQELGLKLQNQIEALMTELSAMERPPEEPSSSKGGIRSRPSQPTLEEMAMDADHGSF